MDPEIHPRRGTVWLAYDGEPECPHWFGYWDLEPDGLPTALEQGPGWASAEAAVRWGRCRAKRVFIRLDDISNYVWAGEGNPPDDPDLAGVFEVDSTGG
jgi:hypothetical protein